MYFSYDYSGAVKTRPAGASVFGFMGDVSEKLLREEIAVSACGVKYTGVARSQEWSLVTRSNCFLAASHAFLFCHHMIMLGKLEAYCVAQIEIKADI